MGIVGEAKKLLSLAKNLEYYSSKLHMAIQEVHGHSKNAESSKDDRQKEKYLKYHLYAFNSARQIKEKYTETMKQIEHQMKVLEKEIEAKHGD